MTSQGQSYLLTQLLVNISNVAQGAGVVEDVRKLLAQASLKDLGDWGPGKVGAVINHVVVGQTPIFVAGLSAGGVGRGGVWSG